MRMQSMHMGRSSIAMLALAFAALLTTLAALAFPASAFADTLPTKSGWTVTFTAAGEMVDNYSEADFADDIKGAQPGDELTFTVTLVHENASAADWYMSNDVMKTLEEGARYGGTGSAYEYVLTYNGPSGTKVLYDSKTVGGDVPQGDEQGMKEATSGLKDFMYLDNLSKGQTATVTLKVTLDGETEQNAYFDTLAQLKMKFAVELDSGTTTTTSNKNVKTGDSTDLFPFYVAMAVSGALLMAIAVGAVVRRRRENGRGAR